MQMIYHSYVEDIIVTDEDMELNLKIEEREQRRPSVKSC